MIANNYMRKRAEHNPYNNLVTQLNDRKNAKTLLTPLFARSISGQDCNNGSKNVAYINVNMNLTNILPK